MLAYIDGVRVFGYFTYMSLFAKVKEIPNTKTQWTNKKTLISIRSEKKRNKAACNRSTVMACFDALI